MNTSSISYFPTSASLACYPSSSTSSPPTILFYKKLKNTLSLPHPIFYSLKIIIAKNLTKILKQVNIKTSFYITKIFGH